MENFQNEQDIRWIKVTNPSTGEVYYTIEGGTLSLENTTVSNAITASYALSGGSGGGSTNTGSLLTTASFSTPNLIFTKGDRSTFNVDLSSLTVTSASYAVTASYFSGSITNAISSSYALTASYILNAVSTSFATTASYALTSSKTMAVSGTTNYVSKFSSDASIGNSQIFDNDTNVGIGTTSPLTKFHVAINDNTFAGNTLLENTNTGSSAQSAIAFKTANNANSFAVGQINSGGGAVLYNAANADMNFYTNASTRMTITAGGNIGIGTTNPTSASLQVNGNIFASSFTGSLLGTASYATNHAVITSSYICDGILTANQTFATGSDVIIAFIDYLDPNGWLTSNQFKPTIAGYYNISFGVWLQNPGISSNQVNTQMRKNGNSMILSQQPLNNGTGIGLGGSRIIQMNGTTDYIDWTIFQGSGDRSTGTILQGTVNGSGTWFSAFLITQ